MSLVNRLCSVVVITPDFDSCTIIPVTPVRIWARPFEVCKVLAKYFVFVQFYIRIVLGKGLVLRSSVAGRNVEILLPKSWELELFHSWISMDPYLFTFRNSKFTNINTWLRHFNQLVQIIKDYNYGFQCSNESTVPFSTRQQWWSYQTTAEWQRCLYAPGMKTILSKCWISVAN